MFLLGSMFGQETRIDELLKKSPINHQNAKIAYIKKEEGKNGLTDTGKGRENEGNRRGH